MSAKLVMGPVLFHWPAETLRDFYFRIADEAEVDTVCVGEVVCSKRMPFFKDHMPEVIQRLQRAGKEVVLSSLSLMSDKREEAAMRELIALAPGLVEANDVAVLRELGGKPHMIGPFINIYNEDALGYLVRGGAVRACLNPEVPGNVVNELAQRSTVPLEVMVFGRQPLAISARCFHARAEGRTKDGCQFACNADPDGRVVRTIEDVGFLALNGCQTLSYTCGNLVHELAPLQQAGVERFRLSPQSGDMVATARIFRAVLDGKLAPAAAVEQLSVLHPDLPFANGFYYAEPGHRFVQPAAAEAALN
ncbi:Ubiquinone biosynthesis protein UbiV [Rhodovastum atsumiense]|uniref:Ubiquinone biosynthesis protein UbiV n=1 Tax=Rhodovastum atsumiense TaxID=504468 RepID=A0A5M6IJF5_9PROT|nr:U32 family peptidase [Rhodovastum atsumiense]KAA5608406.1 U32 family peptidase [Rhodovastum atsumiense]CAH2599405.1 Ubiquinone biosynthesis protein UbiV [Rhodovastum atsumiense]